MRKAAAVLGSLRHWDVVWEAWEFGGSSITEFGALTDRGFRALHRKELTGALETLPERDDAELLFLRGRLLALLGERTPALAALERSARLERAAPALAALGLLWAPSDHGRAAGYFEQADAADPAWGLPRLWLAAVTHRFPDAEPGGAFVSYLRGKAFLRAGRWGDAETEAAGLLAAAPGSPGGWLLLCRARLGRGDWKGAFEAHGRARDLDPAVSFPGTVEFGLDQQEQRRVRSGLDLELQQLDRALAAHPDGAVFWVERAEILRDPWFNRFDEAIESFRRAETLAPDRAWIQASMARAESRQAGLEAGLARLERAQALAPGAGWIHAWRGEMLRLLGRDREALSAFDAAVKAAPAYAPGHAWRGSTLAAAERWAEAAEALDRALGLGLTFPSDAHAHATRSRARRATGDGLGAVEDMTRAFQLDEKYATGLDDGEPAALAAELGAVAAAHPRHAWTRAWRGWMRYRSGDAAGARADFDAALGLEPAHPWALTWRGLLRREAGDAAGAAGDLEAALRAEPALVLAACLLADHHASAGRVDQAHELLKRERRGSRTNAALLCQRGGLALRLGRPADAVADLERAVALDRGWADAFVLLARARLEAGDAAGAEAAAARALTLKPELAGARDA